MVLSFRVGRTGGGDRRKESSTHRQPLRFAWPRRLQPPWPSHAAFYPMPPLTLGQVAQHQQITNRHPSLRSSAPRPASKGPQAGRDFARLLARGIGRARAEAAGERRRKEASQAATPELTPRASGWRWRVADLLKPSPFASPQRGASAQDERCNKKINPSTQGEKAGAKGGRPGPLHRLRRVLFLDAKSNRSRARGSRQPQA